MAIPSHFFLLIFDAPLVFSKGLKNNNLFVLATIGAHGSDLLEMRNADLQLATSASVRKLVHAVTLL